MSGWLASIAGTSVRDFYAEIGVDLPDRGGTEASVRCFANPEAHSREDRNPSCSVSLVTGLWCCHGCGRKGNAFAAAVALGIPEKRAGELAQRHGVWKEGREKERMPSWPQVRKWKLRLAESPKILARLYELKGWTPSALSAHHVGWDGERLTFWIQNHKARTVGLVRYLPNGSPKSVSRPGSKRDLFPRPEIAPRDRPLFIVEGEPAVISVRSCGHRAIGIPGAASWRSQWASRLATHPRVIILPDCDAQGRRLAETVNQMLPKAKVIDIDPGREDGYDIGDLVAEAAGESGGLRDMGRLLDGMAA